jgi:ribosomal protein S18 acetylase RimI-like enzyme
MDAAMVAEIAIPASATGHLRRIDMRRDLVKVADLVELCFYNTLDPEGKQYLRDMRRAAQNASWLVWASNMIEEAPMPPSGFVWEEAGQLVGNLSLIPISVQGKRGYMIANVATHPDFRGQGIARALTAAALNYARDRNANTTWLQVRDDNPAAIHIYATTGFIERLRRTSWYSGPSPEESLPQPGLRVSKRRSDHWSLQREWLKRIYPTSLEWHLPLDWNLFRIDVWGRIYRFLNLDHPQHWSVERGSSLKGVVTWKPAGGFTNPLWLAIPDPPDDVATLALLTSVRRHVRVRHPLSLNYPAGLAVDVLHRAGFYPHQTLIWMEYQLAGR